MRVLGIDPGTATTGYGVVEEIDSALQLITYGVITTPSSELMPIRLQTIFQQLSGKIAEFQPEQVAVEELFFSRNVTSAIAVGQARGVVLLAAAEANLPVSEYTPRQVKQAIAGYGGADKNQVQQMVRLLLNLQDIPRPDDAADAIAIAVCHLHSARVNALLA